MNTYRIDFAEMNDMWNCVCSVVDIYNNYSRNEHLRRIINKKGDRSKVIEV